MHFNALEESPIIQSGKAGNLVENQTHYLVKSQEVGPPSTNRQQLASYRNLYKSKDQTDKDNSEEAKQNNKSIDLSQFRPSSSDEGMTAGRSDYHDVKV